MNDDGPIITCQVSFKRGGLGRKRLGPRGTRSTGTPLGRVPRVSKLVALSLRINGLIEAGQIRDWADAARLSHITRARASQIAGLSLLAPDIIDGLLHLPLVERGRDPIVEHDLRAMTKEPSWSIQRRMWREVLEAPAT